MAKESKKKTAKKADTKKNRREVRSISEVKNQMTTPKRKGFVRRWVNDTDNRPQLFVNAGWDIVRDETPVGDEGVVNQNQSLGSGARKYVGSDKEGHPLYAILMEIPESDYKLVQSRKQVVVDEIDNSIHEALRNGNKYGEFNVKITK